MFNKCLLTLFSIVCLFSFGINAAETQGNANLMQNQIKHVVVLMLENRSFDNVLAWLYDKDHPPQNFIPSDSNQEYIGLSEDTLEQYTNTLKNSKGGYCLDMRADQGNPIGIFHIFL